MVHVRVVNTGCIFLLVLILLSAINGQAQSYQSGYYIGLWVPADEHKYDVKRLITPTDSGYLITDYRKNGKLKFEGLFASINPVVEDGHLKFYGKKGALEAEGNYVNGTLSGKWKFYNEDASLKKEVNYDFQIAKCQVSDDSTKKLEILSIDSIRIENRPVYPGANEIDMYRFIYAQLVYPPLAAMYFKSGKIIGKFKIDEQGYVCDVHTEGEMDKDLQMETRRVLSLLSRWKPATVNGVPVAVQMTIPINFQFQ